MASHVRNGLHIDNTGVVQFISIVGLIDIHPVLEVVNLDGVPVLVTGVTGHVTVTGGALSAVLYTGHIVLVNAEKRFVNYFDSPLNKHCEILVSCSDKGTACKLM